MLKLFGKLRHSLRRHSSGNSVSTRISIWLLVGALASASCAGPAARVAPTAVTPRPQACIERVTASLDAPIAATTPCPDAAPTADPSFPVAQQAAAAAVAFALSRFVSRIRVDAQTHDIAYDSVVTGETIVALRRSMPIYIGEVEWHGNNVGRRWQQAIEPACARCEAYSISSIDFFDGHISLLSLASTLEIAPGVKADALCEAVRAGMRVAAEIQSEPCQCIPPTLPSDISSHFMTAGHIEPSCEPNSSSGYAFSVSPGGARPHSHIDGTVSLRGSKVYLELQLTGVWREAFQKASHYRGTAR